MKRSFKHARVVLLGVVGCLLLWGLLQPREPTYEGQSLDYWLDRLYADNNYATNVFLRIGPKAIPFLFNKTRAQDPDSPIQRTYRAVWTRLPGGLRRHLSEPCDGGSPDSIGLALSLAARGEIRLVSARLEDTNKAVRQVAIIATRLMKPDPDLTVPILARLLSDPEGMIREEASLALAQLSPNKQAIPALIEAARGGAIGPWNRTPGNAAMALGGSGPEARAAVPVLTRMLSDTNSYSRQQAAVALWRINRDTSVIPLLIEEMRKDTTGEAWMILMVFGEMGPLAKIAVPAILERASDSGDWGPFPSFVVRPMALDTLAKIDPKAAAEAHLRYQNETASEEQEPENR